MVVSRRCNPQPKKVQPTYACATARKMFPPGSEGVGLGGLLYELSAYSSPADKTNMKKGQARVVLGG